MSRPRLPTAVKKLRGTLQPSRLNRAEPKPEPGIPDPPPGLSEAALAIWPAIAAALGGMRVVAKSDAIALAGLCECLGEIAAARAALARPVKVGRRVIAKAGARTYATTSRTGAVMLRARPEVAMVSDADRRLQAWLTKFGLSPADRSRVSAAGLPAADNRFAKYGRPKDAFDTYLADDPTGSVSDFDAFLARKPRPDVPPQ
jgi:P27 family predicted phage terminase small subunit